MPWFAVDVFSMKRTLESRQLRLLNRSKSEYGGDLLKTRAGRSHGRPLSTRETMHLVLRSTKAKGEWSFLRAKNNQAIRRILARFSTKHGVRILSIANAGNHLHLQIKLTNRFGYASFIRAVTGAIAMAITRQSRWNSVASAKLADRNCSTKFWDARPFTRIAKSFAEYVNLKNYVRLNEIESMGFSRREAREMVAGESRP